MVSLTSGSLTKNIFKYSLPLIFGNILQVMFNMADIAVAGRFAGPVTLGAVGSTPQFLFLFTGLAMGMGAGVNVISAFYLGQKNNSKLSWWIDTSFIVCLATGIVFGLAGYFSCEYVLKLMKTKDEFLPGAVSYFKILMCSLPANMVYNFGSGFFTARGDTKRPLIYLSIAGVINVILNLVFVIAFKMECRGVAWATLIAEYISAFLIVYPVVKGAGEVKLCLTRLKFSLTMTLRLLKIGLLTGLQNAIFAIANIFVQSGINTLDSKYVQGNAAGSNFDPVIYTVMNAFYTACASFISQNYGAQQFDRIKKSYYICLLYAWGAAAVLGGLLFAAGRYSIALFTAEPAIIEAGYERLRIMAFSYCVSAFMDNAIAANRGLGKTTVPSIIVILGSCVFRIVWVYTIFAWYRTVESLFLLYAFSWAITALFEMIYFEYVYKKITARSKGKINIIAAVGKNGVIGIKGQIPWNIPEDLHHFKELTYGHVVVMGRKTLESMGHILPGRTNVVISSCEPLKLKKMVSSDELVVCSSLEKAIGLFKGQTIFLCGGEGIYREGFKYASKVYLTKVDSNIDGDAFFPMEMLEGREGVCVKKCSGYSFLEYEL